MHTLFKAPLALKEPVTCATSRQVQAEALHLQNITPYTQAYCQHMPLEPSCAPARSPI